MKDLLIKDIKIMDPASPHYTKTSDVQIKNGKIEKIGKNLEGKNIFDGKGLQLLPGLVDLRAHVQEPGEEQKEDFASLEKVAMAGGFTHLCIHPYNEHSLQNKQDVEFLLGKANKINLLPIAAATKNLKGIELAELYDMKQSSVRGFSNGNKAISHAGVMHTILQYVANIDSTLFLHSQLDYMKDNWQVAETAVNTKTGLKGLPAIAESVMVNRDLSLAEYNETKIHFSHISTEESVRLIKEAKKKGVKVTADVSIMHLLFSDEDAIPFDSNYKCNPPLRTKKDQKALLKGLKEGTINAISSDHLAQDAEAKNVEFDYAEFGVASLQWLLPKALELDLEMEVILKSLSCNPACVLRLEDQSIKENNPANFILYDPKEKWTLDSKNNASKCENHPFMNEIINGKVKAVYTKNTFTKV